jgi:hypothetical protein
MRKSLYLIPLLPGSDRFSEMEHRIDRSLARTARAALTRGHGTLGQGWRRFNATPYRTLLVYLLAKKWLFFAVLVGIAMLDLPLPEGLTEAGRIVLTMSVVATILFVTEPIPLPAVALLIVVGQVLLLGLDSSEVARSLMSDSVLFIMGSLMIAVAVVKQKLDKRLAFLIIRFTGTRTSNVCMGIALVSGVLASFIGEHTVAAMMLPVGVTLISLTSDDPARVRRLAIVVLLSISYGASIAGIGTPSGGARNAIMIGYWREFFFDPGNPETFRYAVDYLKWMAFAYPVFLIQIPFVTSILLWTFRPKQKSIARAVVRLRAQLADQGPMKPADWATIGLFVLILFGWILLSDGIGLGTVAVLGAAAFLVVGLVRWEERQLGRRPALRGGHLARRRDEGDRCGALGRRELPVAAAAPRRRLRARSVGRRVGAHRGGHQHHVQRCRGRRARPDHVEPGRRGRRGSAGDRLHHGGLLGLRLSYGGRHAGLHHRLRVGLSAHNGFSPSRLENDGGIDHHYPAGGLALLAVAVVSERGRGTHGSLGG